MRFVHSPLGARDKGLSRNNVLSVLLYHQALIRARKINVALHLERFSQRIFFMRYENHCTSFFHPHKSSLIFFPSAVESVFASNAYQYLRNIGDNIKQKICWLSFVDIINRKQNSAGEIKWTIFKTSIALEIRDVLINRM